MSDIRELVLVGAGHAHVQVLRRFMMRPPEGVRTTLVVDRPEAVYSGMVPGLVAGDYAVAELEIDAVPLARRARARVVLSPALRIDPVARRVELEGRPPIGYDVASLDVGSTVRGLELPGVAEHALATRPIRSFVDRVDALLGEEREAPQRVVIVGTGAAGVELAFTLEARMRGAGGRPEISLVGDEERLLRGYPERVTRAAVRAARTRGIGIRLGARVLEVRKDAALLAGGETLPADLVVWATGAAPIALLGDSQLPKDEAGFVRVRPTLQVEEHDDLFAVGDCAALAGHPWVPKAGVYAVRQGPRLEHNLRARLAGRRLRRYRPQRDFLSLLNLGEGRALGAKWGFVASGRALFRLKDHIDRRFTERFQVLASDGELAARFPTPESMGMEEMSCGGCAAKLGASDLERALSGMGAPPADDSVVLGLETPDDAAAFRTGSGDLVYATVDAFRAFTDDAFLVGRIAAVNAVSDVLAKGGAPRHALALVSVPEDEPRDGGETLSQVLAGVRAALDPLGVSLVGGHTTRGPELFVGLSVTGEGGAGELPLSLDGLCPGDVLILTKPLGTGVLLAADMQGRGRGRWLLGALDAMLRPNVAAARVARELRASACTDVSGFGLAGHLAELLRASGAAATLRLASLPALPGALDQLRRGIRSTYHEQNATLRGAAVVAGEVAGDPRLELLFDPQTSGGLLFGIDPARVDEALRALRAAGDAGAAAIGRVTEPRADGALLSLAR